MINEYLKIIKRIISEKTGHDISDITIASAFQDDLNIGEMEFIEILGEIEEELEVELIEDKDNIHTVQDLVDILIEKLE